VYIHGLVQKNQNATNRHESFFGQKQKNTGPIILIETSNNEI
jgi:hypothetical protein